MCGLLAEISSSLSNKRTFDNLLELSKKRGPDSAGYWTNNYNIQFGFNRLAILDTSVKGNQPIISPTERFVLMLNGEIYNYEELRMAYEIPKERLRSGSDAEVLSHLLESKSIEDLITELDGMFSLCIYDKKRRTLTIARDFAGIKPLFYGNDNDTVIVASQFNQIFNHPSYKSNLSLRPEIVKEFIGLGYMHSPNTVFKRIYQVEPGEIIVFDVDTKKILSRGRYHKWSDIPEVNESHPNLPKYFNDCFAPIIRSQLQSDVPLATFLSGGVDSPLVTAHARDSGFKTKAFTLELLDPKLNEAEIARIYAKYLGVEHSSIAITEEEILASVDDHFQNIPEPHGDYSSVPTWIICNRARDYATVMLSGDGGDELFWGYPRFLRAIENLKWFYFPLKLRKVLMVLYRRYDKNLPWGPQQFSSFGEWTLYKQIRLLGLNQLLPNIDFSIELRDLYNFEGVNSTEALRYLKRNEFYAHMQRVLRKVDLMSMDNSLEVRVPFLAKRIIEFSNKINPELGVKHAKPKRILKDALNQFLPKEILNLEKRGFAVPIAEWMRGPLRPDIEKYLLLRPLYGADFFDKKYFTKIVDDFYEGNNKDTMGIWHLYSWQKWAYNNGLMNDKSCSDLKF